MIRRMCHSKTEFFYSPCICYYHNLATNQHPYNCYNKISISLPPWCLAGNSRLKICSTFLLLSDTRVVSTWLVTLLQWCSQVTRISSRQHNLAMSWNATTLEKGLSLIAPETFHSVCWPSVMGPEVFRCACNIQRNTTQLFHVLGRPNSTSRTTLDMLQPRWTYACWRWHTVARD